LFDNAKGNGAVNLEPAQPRQVGVDIGIEREALVGEFREQKRTDWKLVGNSTLGKIVTERRRDQTKGRSD